jgi:hypothetical protein
LLVAEPAIWQSESMKWARFAMVFIAASIQFSSAQTPPAPAPGTVKQPTLAEMERMYLDGKITAREFQKFLQTHRPEPAAPAKETGATNEVHARALEVLRKTAPNTAANRQGPAITEPLPEPARPKETNETAKAAVLQDVESKLDELLRLKQAREQTNSTVTSTNAPAGPKTKRDRLDEALRLYIQGKLTDAEYKDRRAKILAEPD